MNSANNKYSFDRVSVAGTKLLVNTKTTDRQPQVLVLNSRLDKCHDQYLDHEGILSELYESNCSTCCLEIEVPEFRRRSSSVRPLKSLNLHNNNPCFATCQTRRSVNIELNSKTQLNALTRPQNLYNYRINETRPTIKCNSEISWPFSKFEPHLDIDNDSSNLTLKKNYTSRYSRFSSNQLPSISIDSIEINFDLKKRKEIVAIGVHSNRNRKHQQIILKETLLINEFDCWEETNITTNRPIGKYNLLTLINLETAPRSQSKNEIQPIAAQDISPESSIDYPQRLKSIASQGKRDIKSELANTTTATITTMTPSSTATVGTKAINSSLDRNLDKQSKSKKTVDYNPEIMLAATQNVTTSINQRMDISSPTISSNQSQSNKPTTRIQSNNGSKKPLIDQLFSTTRFSNEISNQTTINLINHPFISELDSIKLRLKSSSFLTFTVWSSFVILTYTLCLLVYLRTRRRFQTSDQLSSRPRKRATTTVKTNTRLGASKSTSSPSSSSSSKHQLTTRGKGEILKISEPFNLQMSNETRSRLETMLRPTEKEVCGQQNNGGGPLSTKVSWKDELASAERIDNNLNLFPLQKCTKSYCHEFQEKHEYFDEESIIDSEIEISNETLTFPTEYTRYPDYYSDYDYSSSSIQRKHSTSSYNQLHHQQPMRFNYAGTLNVVRALRQAATLARSRFRNPRYRPNLNVIPESDFEYLQSSPSQIQSRLQPQPQHQQQSPQRRRDAPELFDHNSIADHYHGRSSQQPPPSPPIINDGGTDCLVPDQIDSLVQDAMSRECSHLLRKSNHLSQNNCHHQTIATLFSRPNLPLSGSLSLETQREQQVSRSRILRQVAKHELYDARAIERNQHE